MTARRCAIALLVFAAQALARPGVLHAQQPPGDPDRPTLLLGPVEVRPRLVFRNVGVDSNIFNEAENPKQDFTATIAPDLELAINPPRMRLSVLTSTEFVYFDKYKDERSANRSFGARAEADLNVLRPFLSFTVARTRARVNDEIDARAWHRPRTISGGTRIRVASKSSLVLTARRTTEEYDEAEVFRGVELARTLDSTTNGYDAAFAVDVTPLTTVSLNVLYERARFEQSPERDANAFRIAPAITISPLGLLTGTASVGYRRLNALDARMPDHSGLSASGSLGMVLADRYRFETSFLRDVRYSYETELPYYVQTGGRGTISTYLLGGFDVRILGGRETLRYRAFAGEDDPGPDRVSTYGGGVGYRIGDRMQIVVTAERVTRRSRRDTAREYANDRVLATLNWGASTR